MTVVNFTTGEIVDRLLDALDDAPLGSVEGQRSFAGRLATIQWLAARLGVSDTTSRAAVMRALDMGLVQVWDAVDTNIGRRRLLVTGGA